jgi:predicted nucleic acid-binding protein
MVVIDTSIIIDHLRCPDKTKSIFTNLITQGTQSISILTYAELFSGKSVWQSNKAKQTIQTLCDNLNILPITSEIAVLAGKIKLTHHLDLVDCLIAATSIVFQFPLSTLNIKHFRSIPSLKLYSPKSK